MSPARVDRCVESLMKDPKFKPKKPDQSKKDAAWALCTWMENEGLLTDSSVGVKVMENGTVVRNGPFKVVLPITGARRQLVEKAEGEEEVQLWLHVEASGPERDADGDRMSEDALTKMVEYATEKEIPFLDGHYKDLMSAMLGDVHNPYLTEQNHFAFDVLLNQNNPFTVNLFNDILAGKKHGASIAGVVHAADIEEYSENEFGSLFHDVELIEVSRTSWPSWRDSFVTLLADKVGKLPQAEFDEVMKRRDELVKVKDGKDDMIVKTIDGGMEEEKDNLTIEILEGEEDLYVTKFVGSPRNRYGTHSSYGFKGNYESAWRCHFSQVNGGALTPKASGPIRGTVRRTEMIAAAMKPACDLPGTDSISARKGKKSPLECSFPGNASDYGLDGWDKPETEEDREGAKLSCSDLKIIKRAALAEVKRRAEDREKGKSVEVVDDLLEELGVLSWEYEEERQRIQDLLTRLGKTCNEQEFMEVLEMSDKEKPVVTPEEEITETATEETVTEAAPEEVEPVEEKQEPVDEEVVSEPEESALGKVVDARLQASKFGELIYAMQEMVLEAVEGQKLEDALKVLDDFTVMSKDVLTQLIAAQPQGEMALSFLGPIESRVELATGRLTKSRVEQMDGVIDSLVEQLVGLREVMKNADTTDDTAVLEAVKPEKAEDKSAHTLEFERRLDAIEAQRKSELDTLAATLASEEREQPSGDGGDAKGSEPIELTPEEQYQLTTKRFLESVK